MGTRSITVVKARWSGDEYKPIATIYRHWDGYPEGHGADLATFLDGLELVNGIGGTMPPRYANGPGRLAAQLVSFLQDAGHDPDLMAHDVTAGQEFEYHILCDAPTLSLRVQVYDGPMTAFGLGGEECTHLTFDGTVPEYLAWIAAQKQAAATD